jgi:hypothetical protein
MPSLTSLFLACLCPSTDPPLYQRELMKLMVTHVTQTINITTHTDHSSTAVGSSQTRPATTNKATITPVSLRLKRVFTLYYIVIVIIIIYIIIIV